MVPLTEFATSELAWQRHNEHRGLIFNFWRGNIVRRSHGHGEISARIRLRDRGKRGRSEAADALRMAEEAQRSVELLPRLVQPVCRLMDYGKFKYRRRRSRTKRSEAKPIQQGVSSDRKRTNDTDEIGTD